MPFTPWHGGQAPAAGICREGEQFGPAEAVLVYYGAADAFTAVAEFSGQELLDAITAPG